MIDVKAEIPQTIPPVDLGEKTPFPAPIQEAQTEQQKGLWQKVKEKLPFWKQKVQTEPEKVVEEISKVNEKIPEQTPVQETSPENVLEEEVSKESSGYSTQQTEYIKNHYNLEPNKSNLLITRSQVTQTIPTALRSCSVIKPGQNSFYSTQGYIFEIPADEIPWISGRDAGTSMTSNEIAKPEKALTPQEFLDSKPSGFKYNETVINFGNGLSNKVKALYDFREIPPEPSLTIKLTQPSKYKEIISERNYIIHDRQQWEEQARSLGIPFVTELPDKDIVEEVRRQDSEARENYNRLVVNPIT